MNSKFYDLHSNNEYTIEICNSNKNILFVFGDNIARKGIKGQMCIRYCENAFGFPIRYRPSTHSTAYFIDKNYEENKKIITKAIEQLIEKYNKDNYELIYFPNNSLGTGLTKLKQYAPKTIRFLHQQLKRYFGIEYN